MRKLPPPAVNSVPVHIPAQLHADAEDKGATPRQGLRSDAAADSDAEYLTLSD